MSLLSAQQLSDHLQCSISTVYRLARTNQIPTVQVGRSLRFDLTVVEAALTRAPAAWTQSNQSRGRARVHR